MKIERIGEPHLNQEFDECEKAIEEFKNQGITIPATKGLTLIWPSEWTHTHKGVISHTSEKYIVTGWFGFNE